MKRSWKVFWIVCIVLAGLGIILCTAGLGFGVTLDSLKENAVIYRHNGDYDSGIDTELTDDNTETFEGIRELEIDVHGGLIEIVEGDTEPGVIRVESSDWSRGVRLNIQKDADGTLSIKTKKAIRGWHNNMFGRIYIVIPEEMNFEEVSISIGAGELNIENIRAGSLDVEAGVGEIDIQNFTTEELDAECGAGSIYLQGEAKQEIDINCNVGNVDYTAAGSFNDYNYDLKCSVGEIELDGVTYTGLGREKKIEQGQAREMNIECSVGSVTVNFMED